MDVSIVIVSMNKPDVLRTCLDSLRAHTREVSYETIVVAYLYNPASLLHLQADYPWVIWIESNEIRGFSENNNLALRQASGRYCFVVNDDTEIRMPIIDRLASDFDKVDEHVAVFSPVVCKPDGSIQYSGRNKFTLWRCIKLYFNCWSDAVGPYTHGKGLFQSYNIVGASFMIRTDIFRQMGWFDEYYFFCPEDIALSSIEMDMNAGSMPISTSPITKECLDNPHRVSRKPRSLLPTSAQFDSLLKVEYSESLSCVWRSPFQAC